MISDSARFPFMRRQGTLVLQRESGITTIIYLGIPEIADA
jgi:hypothetical protein